MTALLDLATFKQIFGVFFSRIRKGSSQADEFSASLSIAGFDPQPSKQF